MVQQFGWTRSQVTSGNALSKLVVGSMFALLAGWIVDRFGAPSLNDGRHCDSGSRASGIGLDLQPRDVLLPLLF